MMISNLTRTLCISGALLFSSATAMADQYTEGYNSAYGENYSEAYSKWYPLAINGDPRAQFNLGLMYHSGLFVDMDESRALYWYHKAAENGIREAQEYLVVGYGEGWFGLPRDPKKSRFWEQKLASTAY